jgi:hypothetical protein
MITKTMLFISIIIALIIGGFIGRSMGANSTSSTPSAQTASPAEIGLYTTMRKLWADHVFWTHNYVVAAVNNFSKESADPIAARLMKNQEDIGRAIRPYYGAGAGDQLTALLKEHITIATEVVASAKANDQTKLQDANTRWQANADQIAALLAGANPNWPEEDFKEMLRMHLTLLTNEVTATLSKQYEKSVTAGDAGLDHMMGLADALSAGIVKQFPDKF